MRIAQSRVGRELRGKRVALREGAAIESSEQKRGGKFELQKLWKIFWAMTQFDCHTSRTKKKDNTQKKNSNSTWKNKGEKSISRRIVPQDRFVRTAVAKIGPSERLGQSNLLTLKDITTYLFLQPWIHSHKLQPISDRNSNEKLEYSEKYNIKWADRKIKTLPDKGFEQMNRSLGQGQGQKCSTKGTNPTRKE